MNPYILSNRASKPRKYRGWEQPTGLRDILNCIQRFSLCKNSWNSKACRKMIRVQVYCKSVNWYKFVQKFFGLFFATGMALGFFFPGFYMPVAERTILILGTVITLTFLTIDFRAAASNLKRFHNIGAVVLISKLLLPFVLYQLAKPLGTDISLGVLLLTLTPFASVSPTLTRIIGGDTEFIILSQVLLTLLAPFYMPFLLLLYAGAVIEIDVFQMMRSLLFLILIPFVLSLILRPLFKKAVERTKKYYSAVNILLISLLLTGLISMAADDIKSNLIIALPMTGWVIILGIILTFAGWYCFFFMDRKKRLGLAVGNVYMNIGLTAVIAAGFFSSEVIMFVLLYEIPANLLPALLGRLDFFKPVRQRDPKPGSSASQEEL